ncbi:MAG: GAF domain-containing protein [Acidobacteriales bacterium]|nr:GAF domain-containing protein [Terriglobales bacterium]
MSEPTVESAELLAIRAQLEAIAENATSSQQALEAFVELLHSRLQDYNWVGFYSIEKSLDANEPPMLVLGPFRGAPSPHVRIPLNQGICGAAASGGATIVVDDVNSDPRYLACSIETKSEIVAPVFVHGEVAGELDIDSHRLAAFTPEQRKLVEYCAKLAGQVLERYPT